MLRIRAKHSFNRHVIERRANALSFSGLSHAAAAIRLTARRSIRRGKKQSPAGTPPHTRKGQLKRAILYAVEKQKAASVIGPAYEIAGTSGSAHEFGGRYKKQRYPRRAFMGPALQENLPRLPKMWAGSVR